MADSNKVVIGFGEESTWGTAATALNQLPIVSGSMTESPSTVRSQQLRTDAQYAGTKRTGIEASAQFEVELQGDNLDTLLRAALRNGTTGGSDWSTVSFEDNFDSSIGWTGTDTLTTTSAITDIAIGQWIYVTGFTPADANGWFQVAGTNTNNKTISVVAGTGPSNTATPSSGKLGVKGSQIRNGSDLTSFTIQAEYSDLTNEYRLMTGARVTSFGINVSAQSIMTGSIGFGGKRVTRETTGISTTAAINNDVIGEVDGFDGFWIDGAEVTNYELTSISLNIATAGRAVRGLGELENKAMQLGPLEVTGSMEMYLDATTYSTWLPKLAGFTSFSLGFAINDGAGHRYFFFLPECKLTSEAGSVPGIDQDVMMSMDFSAEPSPMVQGGSFKTIEIVRAV